MDSAETYPAGHFAATDAAPGDDNDSVLDPATTTPVRGPSPETISNARLIGITAAAAATVAIPALRYRRRLTNRFALTRRDAAGFCAVSAISSNV
jgi:hypothetical protein